MRSTKKNTPKVTPIAIESDDGSNKKLKQARLPFKILAETEDAETEATKARTADTSSSQNESFKQPRKRKLSFKDEETVNAQSKECNNKKKIIDNDNSVVIILADSDNNETENLQEQKQTEKDAGTSKIKISLPIKRRKSLKKMQKKLKETKSHLQSPKDHNANGESSDEVELIGVEENPEKRPKIESAKNEVIEANSTKNEINKTRTLDSFLKLNKTKSNTEKTSTEHATGNENTTTATTSNVVASCHEEEEQIKHTNSEAEEEIMSEPAKVKSQKLTAKHLKLIEQRRKAREEKERKIQADKELKKKEREEKEEQRRKEREVKERKRLAELEIKNEEKRKRTEAKEEEQRKKDDERRRKEQEKAEVELKKQRAAAAFSKFFVTKSLTSIGSGSSSSSGTNNNNTDVNNQQQLQHHLTGDLAFKPFQVKNDMTLAPIQRKILSIDASTNLDKQFFAATAPHNELYLNQLSEGKLVPYRWQRRIVNSELSTEDDVQIIEDDLERVGLAIIEEEDKLPVQRMRAKYLKFAENRRPAYYGTWRKTSALITARRPFGIDTKYFDYEVDSEAEWEEEEPGESLDGTDDEKDKESEDDDYEVDNEWFVPHGHLSDEELQNAEDNVDSDDVGEGSVNVNNEDANSREAQKVKLQLLQQEFVQEMKKETKKIKPRLIGCIWVDENGNKPLDCPNIIWETLNKRAIMCTETPISLVEPPALQISNISTITNTTTQEEKLKAIIIDDELYQQLIRLVHGNQNAKVFLVNEFLAYLGQNVNDIKNNIALLPTKSMIREKIDECAKWKLFESEQSKTKKTKKFFCWFVDEDIRKKCNLLELNLQNNWNYILQPKANGRKITLSEAKVNRYDSSDENAVNEANNKSLTTTPTSRALATMKKKTSVITKKRISLLVSIPRVEQIPTNTKNALISKFLKKNNGNEDNEMHDNVKDDDDIILVE